MTPLELRQKLIESIHAFNRSEISPDDLYAIADAYIAALKEYAKRTKKKFRIPSRGYLIRALG
jgi:hypothetical protein